MEYRTSSRATTDPFAFAFRGAAGITGIHSGVFRSSVSLPPQFSVRFACNRAYNSTVLPPPFISSYTYSELLIFNAGRVSRFKCRRDGDCPWAFETKMSEWFLSRVLFPSSSSHNILHIREERERESNSSSQDLHPPSNSSSRSFILQFISCI